MKILVAKDLFVGSLISVLAFYCGGTEEFTLLSVSAQDQNGSEDAHVFAPNIISTGDYESHPMFSADSRTFYFLKSDPMFTYWTIVESHNVNGIWSTPTVSLFSGQYSDADPFITDDGSQFFFISTRPENGSNSKDLDIWVMSKEGEDWGSPRRLDSVVNSTAQEWHPTVALNGTLYFGSSRLGGKGKTDIYYSRFINNRYQKAENLGDIINTEFDEYEPFIDPQERYLVVMSNRPGGYGGSDLYISYYEKGYWTKLENLGPKINSPLDEYCVRLSRDGEYFYWGSCRIIPQRIENKKIGYDDLVRSLRGYGNGLGDIYYIKVSEILQR